MKMAFILSLLLLGGCDIVDSWEYQTREPPDTSQERLMEIRELLKNNGYKRIRIIRSDYWNAICIYATASERDDNK